MKREIVAWAFGDVTGDKKLDRVYVTGIKESEGGYIDKMELVVKNGRTGKVMVVELPFGGYNPRLFLGDFTGDKVSDVFVTIDSGGSGGMTYDYIYSFVNNRSKKLFSSEEYNERFQYMVAFKNFYKVEAICMNNNKKYIIDISQRGGEYLSQIYDTLGRLKKPIEGFVDPISSLFPVDVDEDGTYDLLAFQQISGQYHADSLGYFQNFLIYKENNFELFEQCLGIFGADVAD